MQHVSSAITGLAPESPSSTGVERSALASSKSPDAARAWLVGQRPADVDDRIRRSLTSQLNVVVTENREWRFPEGKAPYSVAISAGLTGLSRDTQPAALAKVEAAMTAVDRDHAERLVSQMSAVLARRNASEETAGIAFDIFVNVLMQHPADVAVEAVRVFCTEPRDGKGAWMPSPPDVESACRTLSASRVALKRAIQGWSEPSDAERHAYALEGEWRRLQARATDLGHKVGPGPASDTGARGDRIAAWDAAVEEATEAKRSWQSALKIAP